MSERPNHENSGSESYGHYEASGGDAGQRPQHSSGEYGSQGYGSQGYETPGYGSAGSSGYVEPGRADPYAQGPSGAYYSQGAAGDPYGAPAAPANRGPATAQAQSQAQTAMILGIVGVVVTIVGVILGPIALSQARKAESGGADATAGRVLGWISTILGGLVALFVIAYIVFIVIAIGVAVNSGY